MLIETLRLMDGECEGYAIRIDGNIEFEYFTRHKVPEDNTFNTGHSDILDLGEILAAMYMTGVETHGEGQVMLKQFETTSLERYIAWGLRGEPCDS
ncbi:hypothetical protein [Brevibacterium paucivorans]|uniref:hypothetical protein n=1 Tax=Brevibacterium paucivorans TaxID=170994 RepID=UPI00321B384B